MLQRKVSSTVSWKKTVKYCYLPHSLSNMTAHFLLNAHLVIHLFLVLQCQCVMGLFPEIQRAYITVDHRLFLWDYESFVISSSRYYFNAHSDDIHHYQDQEQIIVCVGLVKPIPGVFIEQIKYLLVIATPSEVSLVGVSFSGKNGSGKVEMRNAEMSASSDGVLMNSIIGTNQGRIFMCGNNGQLYELVYDSGPKGYFNQSKCRKFYHTTSALSYFLPTFLNWKSEGNSLSRYF